MSRSLAVTCLATLLVCSSAPGLLDPTGALGAPLAALDSIAYATSITTQNLIATTITNYGCFGNNFISRSPSLEYPVGSGYEHLVRGGLWIGARAEDDAGAFSGVSTAALDGSQGTSLAAGSEFTPAGNTILRRSILPASPYFDPQAVSELDLVCSYSDRPARTTSGNPEPHRPLNVLVRQENYSWSFDDYAHSVFFHFVIRNLGAPLTDLWVGLYTEFASGNKNVYSCWPPTSSCGGAAGSWFGKKWVQYEDSLRLLREHYCAQPPVPGGCNLGFVPYWAGIKLLTPPDPASGQKVTFDAWDWSPGNPLRDQDVERYAIMSAGTIETDPNNLQPPTDPVELLALGPFPLIASGDSVTVDFALVGGAEIADIEQHAKTAQQIHDKTYEIPTAAQLSLVSTQAEPGHVRLVWHAPGAGTAAMVYRSERQDQWQTAGRAVADGVGSLVFDDFSVTSGRRYGYRVGLPSPDGEVLLGEVWVDVPERAAFALHGMRPNPASGSDLTVSFSLAGAAPASLALLDVAGRERLRRDLGMLGPGEHLITWRSGRALEPGVYWLRLAQAGRIAATRIVITR